MSLLCHSLRIVALRLLTWWPARSAATRAEQHAHRAATLRGVCSYTWSSSQGEILMVLASSFPFQRIASIQSATSSFHLWQLSAMEPFYHLPLGSMAAILCIPNTMLSISFDNDDPTWRSLSEMTAVSFGLGCSCATARRRFNPEQNAIPDGKFQLRILCKSEAPSQRSKDVLLHTRSYRLQSCRVPS
jgi:hypothetical protein